MPFNPEDIFADCDISEAVAWSEHARYHDVHVTDSDYVLTYLDPTIYTAWTLYNTQTDVPADYITKIRSWNYRVCYFRSEVADSEALRQPVTMGLTSDLFPDTPFTHRLLI